MEIRYYFEYEINKKPQKPEKGLIEINSREYKIIETACNSRKISIKEFLERAITELTIEDVENKLIKWENK